MKAQNKVMKLHQDEIYRKVAQMLSSLGSPVRLKLIHFLSQAPLTVEVLALKCEQSVANTSMHLRKMLGEKILKVENIGQKRLYSLQPALLYLFEECLDFSQAIDPSLTLSQDWNYPFALTAIKESFKKGEIVFLDVRPEEEAKSDQLLINDSRILFISHEKLKKEIHKLPKKKIILIICRGRFCVLSIDVVKMLRDNKINAYRFAHSWFKLKKILTLK